MLGSATITALVGTMNPEEGELRPQLLDRFGFWVEVVGIANAEKRMQILQRRIEFEPDTVPVRLRDCQVINLQMNTMVAGTMLRGMFEDRIQNVIREIKERPNLILFVDEAHTMVGAGSALGAPSDAANVFKSVLARGEVRMIGASARR